MHKRIYFFYESDIKILYIDLSYIIEHDRAMAVIKDALNTIENENDKFYILMNLKNMHYNKRATQYTIDNQEIFKKKVNATAIIEVSPIAQTLINFFNLFSSTETKSFSSRKRAIEWLSMH